jgi:hypothetical protein
LLRELSNDDRSAGFPLGAASPPNALVLLQLFAISLNAMIAKGRREGR